MKKKQKLVQAKIGQESSQYQSKLNSRMLKINKKMIRHFDQRPENNQRKWSNFLNLNRQNLISLRLNNKSKSSKTQRHIMNSLRLLRIKNRPNRQITKSVLAFYDLNFRI